MFRCATIIQTPKKEPVKKQLTLVEYLRITGMQKAPPLPDDATLVEHMDKFLAEFIPEHNSASIHVKHPHGSEGKIDATALFIFEEEERLIGGFRCKHQLHRLAVFSTRATEFVELPLNSLLLVALATPRVEVETEIFVRKRTFGDPEPSKVPFLAIAGPILTGGKKSTVPRRFIEVTDAGENNFTGYATWTSFHGVYGWTFCPV